MYEFWVISLQYFINRVYWTVHSFSINSTDDIPFTTGFIFDASSPLRNDAKRRKSNKKAQRCWVRETGANIDNEWKRLGFFFTPYRKPMCCKVGEPDPLTSSPYYSKLFLLQWKTESFVVARFLFAQWILCLFCSEENRAVTTVDFN